MRTLDLFPESARRWAAEQPYECTNWPTVERDPMTGAPVERMLRRDPCGRCLVENLLLVMGICYSKDGDSQSPGGGLVASMMAKNREIFPGFGLVKWPAYELWEMMTAFDDGGDPFEILEVER